MSFVERVNQGKSLVSWLNWLTEPPAVCWSVIMGDFSPSPKGVYWTLPETFRMGPSSCALHSMNVTRFNSTQLSSWRMSPLFKWTHFARLNMCIDLYCHCVWSMNYLKYVFSIYKVKFHKPGEPHGNCDVIFRTFTHVLCSYNAQLSNDDIMAI